MKKLKITVTGNVSNGYATWSAVVQERTLRSRLATAAVAAAIQAQWPTCVVKIEEIEE